ncbi:MAG: amidase [SAR202 cluster bacterium]|nr:amidase [SAR202 cluster bacterium]
MMKEAIPFLSATELGAAIQRREVSPVEVTEAYLDRIQQVDGKLNAYITVCAAEARQAAKDAEAEIVRKRYRGPLHGVPVGVKDQIHTKGIATTSGSRLRAEFIPEADATVVKRLKDAGAIVLGKLNMSEFALGDPVNSAFGPAHNPWDLERSPGTSSTGSGAATAGFLCATSLGEDTGGSIRGPAANCGLVGLRPTWGRVSRAGVDGASWSVDTIGPVSRTVSDCAITIGAIAGYDPQDPYTYHAAVPDYRQSMTGDVRGIKVGLVREFLDPETCGVEPQTRDAVLAAVQVLRDLGAEVREVSLPLAMQTGVIIRTITHTDRTSLHPEWLRERPQEYHPNTRVAFMTGTLLPAQVYYKAQKLRELVRREVLAALQEVDVLVQPTSAAPAAKMDPNSRVRSKEQAKRALQEGSFRGPYSLSGVPALSILCGFTKEGPGALPLALQIAGRPLEEGTVLRVAHAYEQATPWHKRRPPV